MQKRAMIVFLLACTCLAASSSDGQTFPTGAGAGTCRIVFAGTTANFFDCNVFVKKYPFGE